jgi:threonine/homoserine/homoserine lactone efflux protein
VDTVLFVAGAVSLLATPGPTNTLLATSGASSGLRGSSHLLIAELVGYLATIGLLRSLLGPLIIAAPVLGTTLRLAAALYLIYLATILWRHGGEDMRDGAPVTFIRVLVTTLLNPKAIIFAFTILPSEREFHDLLPWLLCLSALIVIMGAFWIVLGFSLCRGFSGVVSPKLGYRFSAVALTLWAGLIGIHSFGGA